MNKQLSRLVFALVAVVASLSVTRNAGAQQACAAASCPWLMSVEQGFCANADVFEAQARQRLFPLVRVNKCPCNGNSPCTEVKGLREGTIQAVALFVGEYRSPVVLTGGSEPGHGLGEDETSFSHDNGYKVDLVDSIFCSDPACANPIISYSGLSAFIRARFDALSPPPRGDGCNLWGMPVKNTTSPGPQFALEEPPCGIPPVTASTSHWDIAFPDPSAGLLLAQSLSQIGITVTGTGSGRVDATPPLIANCTSVCGNVTFTRGMNVDLVATPDQNSVFTGWSGVDNMTDSTNGQDATIFADGIRTIVAVFDSTSQYPPPPGQGLCWTWISTLQGHGGYAWNGVCGANPSHPTRPPKGCWHWDATASPFGSTTTPFGAWIFDICGGNNGNPSPCPPLNLSSPLNTCLGGIVLVAGDPNDKTGSSGVGTQQYLAASTPLRYAIFFSNLQTASAPAQQVVVTDQLDLVHDDLSTFSLGPIAFGSQILTPPFGVTDYTAAADLRPSNNLIVQIGAHLDLASGQLTWRFTSLDPATGLPTTNPFAGFLAPGAEGSVFFTVKPKNGIATNTQIQNQASIVFDVNGPMLTQVWTNTIDNTAPTSQVAVLPSTESNPSFTVQWSATDVGAGVQDYTIYVSDSGGPFTAFQTNTTAASATFTGQVGHTYGFYSIARDLVGNVEASKTTTEATTQVGGGGGGGPDTTPPVIVPQVAGTQGNNGWYTSDVSVSWSTTDPESGIASSSGCTPTTLTAETAATTLMCSATNGAGLSASGSTTVKIDKTPPRIYGMPAGCTLSPPNKALVQVAALSALDSLSGIGPGTFTINVTSSEPSDPANPDIVITRYGSQKIAVELRADRLDNGTGRTYTLNATATDLAGNSATATATCIVPY